jgi:hypothetical protein
MARILPNYFVIPLGLSTLKRNTNVLSVLILVFIDGWAIYTLGTNALKNGKKAFSIEQSAYKDGKLPSGWSDGDLDKFILDGMWRMLTGSKVYDIEADSEANAEDETSQSDESSDRPDGWIFQGWMAYCVLGPRADKEHQLALFEVGDWVKNKRSAGGSEALVAVRINKTYFSIAMCVASVEPIAPLNPANWNSCT